MECIDGKHIAIFNPPGSGSLYNYNGFFGVVLLPLVKHNYQFVYVNVGCQGRISDGGVFKSTDLYRGIVSSSLHIPKPTPLPKTGDPCWHEDEYADIPYVIVGNDAFQLTNYMMKPYSSRQMDDEHLVYNYRLSRFRRVCENAFGILASRFRLFLSRINVTSLSTINDNRLAGIVVHNMLCEKSRPSYMPREYIDEENPNTGLVIMILLHFSKVFHPLVHSRCVVFPPVF